MKSGPKRQTIKGPSENCGWDKHRNKEESRIFWKSVRRIEKEEIKKEPNKLYVRGETYGTSTVYIDKNLDTCSIAHELGHTQGMNEDQAYEMSNLCYQLVAKGIWE